METVLAVGTLFTRSTDKIYWHRWTFPNTILMISKMLMDLSLIILQLLMKCLWIYTWFHLLPRRSHLAFKA